MWLMVSPLHALEWWQQDIQAVEGVSGRSDEAPLSPLYTNEGGAVGYNSLLSILKSNL